MTDSPHRRYWTQLEVAALIQTVKSLAGEPPWQITKTLSQKLGRSIHSVNGQIERIQHNPQTAPDIRELLTLHVRRQRKRRNSPLIQRMEATTSSTGTSVPSQPRQPFIPVSPITRFASCQFLLGEPRYRRFCPAKPCHETAPYCARHMKICYAGWKGTNYEKNTA